MPLNLVKNKKSNMYQFIDATWNTIKGECYHDCSYCYMKRWGKLNNVHFDEKELKTDLGNGKFIFVGSSCDMFAENIPPDWINQTLEYCKKFDNKYLFQTKNPKRIIDFKLPKHSIICTTIESNIYYKEIMRNSPPPYERAKYMNIISDSYETFVTIEPILDFNLDSLVDLIKQCKPKQVNIGADSCRNNLPEPSKEKVLQLISELQKFTNIHKKSNLKRLI